MTGLASFTEVGRSGGTAMSPTQREKSVAVAKSLGVTFVDADRDGFMDIVVANDNRSEFFCFTTSRNGTFEEVAVLHNVAYDQQGNARGAMGVDFRPKSVAGKHLAIVIGNFSNETDCVLRLAK